jgi:hypothetical protein
VQDGAEAVGLYILATWEKPETGEQQRLGLEELTSVCSNDGTIQDSQEQHGCYSRRLMRCAICGTVYWVWHDWDRYYFSYGMSDGGAGPVQTRDS